MRIGIGLPNPVPGTPGSALPAWARRAEERGFAGLATIDRVAYPNHDSLATLAVAAAVTSRIALVTNILLGPVYPTVLLAKTAATIDQVSGGRLTLGLAPGGRPDDYAAVDRDFGSRGRAFDAQLDLLHRAWRGEPVVADAPGRAVCPPPTHGSRVPVLLGGTSDATLRRLARWGAGWTVGGAAPDAAGAFIERVRNAWREAGRDGEPRLAALLYFSLGDDVVDESRGYLRDYYAFTGPYADQIAASALRSPAAIRDAVTAFTDIGCTELYFDATSSAVHQVDRLADVVF